MRKNVFLKWIWKKNLKYILKDQLFKKRNIFSFQITKFSPVKIRVPGGCFSPSLPWNGKQTGILPSSLQVFHLKENEQVKLYFVLLDQWISEGGDSNCRGVAIIIFRLLDLAQSITFRVCSIVVINQRNGIRPLVKQNMSATAKDFSFTFRSFITFSKINLF